LGYSMLRPLTRMASSRLWARWASSCSGTAKQSFSAARYFLAGGTATVAALGVATFAGKGEAHAAAADATGSAGWFVKPWTSYQAVPTLPDAMPGIERVHVMRRTYYTMSLFTTIRDKDTQKREFVEAARKLSSLLFGEALCLLPCKPKTVTTPVDGATYVGMEIPDPAKELCVVSILRAADAMADEFNRQMPALPQGKILIQRDEETKEAKLFFSKLPSDMDKRRVILVDPMLATGGTALAAIKVLKEAGVPEQSIIMVSVVGAPTGIEKVMAAHPQIQLLVGEVDRSLNGKAYIVPGCGDFGDRFFGTVK